MLETKDYDLKDEIHNYGEEDILNQFFDYSGSTYIGDAIAEIGDSSIPIYYNDIWEHARDLQDYIEEAIAEGLADVSSDVSLTRIFQVGYYKYNTDLLYANLGALLYNAVVKGVNEYLNTLSEEESNEIDLDALEDEIDSRIEADEIDNNSKFSDIDDFIEEIKQSIKNKEFSL